MKNLVKIALVVAGLSLTGNAVKAQQKLAHFNSTELIQAMPEIKAADVKMQTWQKQKQTELEAMNTLYQKRGVEFEEKQKIRSEANKETIDKELTAMLIEIKDFEKRIGEAQQKAEQDMEAKRGELFNPILEKATAAMNAVAKEKGYAYVFDTANPAVVYFGGGEDIQPLIKTKLGIPLTAAK